MHRQAFRRSSPLEQRTFTLVLGAFALFGTVFGCWLVLLAELQLAFSLSPATLGAALTAGLTASLVVMPLSGRAINRRGSGWLITLAVSVIGGTFVGTALAPNVGALVLLFLLFYSATAAFDVGINAAAIGFEQRSKRQVMSYFHAAFSGFAALTALVVGGLNAGGVPFRLLYLGAALLAASFGLVVWRSGLLQIGRGERGDAPAAAQPGRLRRSPAVWLLAATTALAFLAEGELGNWATIYLRSSLELSALVGASGFAAFHAAMFAGRLLGGRLSTRWGRWPLLRAAGASVGGGMLLALGTDRAALVVAGFLLVGLALSVVAPTVYSLVGDAAPDRCGEASSVLTTVGYSGYLIGPVLVGGVAEVAGLRLALATVALAGVGIVLLSGAARRHTVPRTDG